MRKIKYADAISEALVQEMKINPKIFITGIGVDYPSGVFGTTKEAFREFGEKRVFDSPAMENALTGICIGAASMGMRPVLVHHRNDFLLLALDQMLNLAAKWRYMYGGNAGTVPIVVRAIIGRGWGQGATHSQSLQSGIAHFPGICVVMPASPVDAKGLLISALNSNTPTLMLEHRSLFDVSGEVPETRYEIQMGKANIIRTGKDVTVVCTSHMVMEALRAADFFASFQISIEVIDLRCIRPLDEQTVINSVIKTGKLVIADTSWVKFGVTSEIAALVAEKAFQHLRTPIVRIGLPDCSTPAAKSLEDAFYPTAHDIVRGINQVLKLDTTDINIHIEPDTFKGPY